MRTLVKRVGRLLGAKLWRDERMQFNDVGRLGLDRQASPLIQFYSSNDNIGNYTAVAGTHDMLGHAADVWCMHQRPVDFAAINRRYQGAIIGGAGLFHKVFTPFWRQFAEQCTLPVIFWGLGGCYIDGENEAVERDIVRGIASRADLINVRDDVTAEYYGFEGASIAACPTVVYLERFGALSERSGVLFASHAELTGAEVEAEIAASLAATGWPVRRTDNVQRPDYGLERIIRQDCRGAAVVASSRLHGAIIAYGLGIPYVAVPRDEKMRAFHRLYGNGLLCEDPASVADAVLDAEGMVAAPVAVEPVKAFGRRAAEWVRHLDRRLPPGPAVGLSETHP